MPRETVVPEGFAPPGTPVEVRLQWDNPGPAVVYNATPSGATEALLFGGNAGVATLLLLPFALVFDAAVGVSNAARERQARRLAESVTVLPDRARLESFLTESLRTELGWVAPDQAGGEGLAAPERLVISVTPVFALRPDARALLFEFRLSTCPADELYEGKLCADDRALAATVLVHSDSLPEPVKDDATRARLARIIDDLYDLEGLAGTELKSQQRRRDAALDRANADKLYPDEATLLAIDAWVADGGARLQESYAAAVRDFAGAIRAMREHPGPPKRNSMTTSRVLVPMAYDDELPVNDLDEIEAKPDGRRLLRSRVEPMRAAGSGRDPAANIWFSVPTALDTNDHPEQALIDFLYRPAVASRPR